MRVNTVLEEAVERTSDGAGADLIGRSVGNYVIERHLARGGMGSLFVARHPALGREVAVKFISRDLDTDSLSQRFLDEARVTASLRHPNIVDILDFGQLDGRFYYVMELLAGCDLAAVIRARGRFHPTEVAAYIDQICSALEAAHAVGVVHRDLKPANVFVLAEHPPRVKLMDFGIAKFTSTKGTNTMAGQVLGTPSHMAPEQALGDVDRITPQSDLYSLGAIAYEMLAGRPVFTAPSDVLLMICHVRDPVTPLADLVADIDADVAALVEQCLAKEPSARPASARELATALRQVVARSVQEEPAPSVVLREVSPRLELEHAVTVVQRAPGAATVHDEHHEPVSRIESRAVVRRALEDAPNAPPPASSPPPSRPRGAREARESSPQQLAGGEGQRGEPVLPLPVPEAVILEAPPQYEEAPPSLTVGDLVVRADVTLTDDDRSTLNKLLLRMQKKGDFPAFVRNVGEVSQKADADSSFSASQLGSSILKDYALTAKLLRLVNFTYANRFGGKVHSVQQAIVILGFDRVRSMALGISIFKNPSNQRKKALVSDSAITSLVSGQLAKELAGKAKIKDPEQAMVCSMFRNLGHHLVLVYLPDLYERILELVRDEGLTMHQASERVLGMSFRKLGVGIAERWKLPKSMLLAMSSVPPTNAPAQREEDRISSLAEFSNDLCEIVSNAAPERREADMLGLLERHKHLLSLDREAVTTLLQGVESTFEQRYASLLGPDAKASRFMRSMRTLVPHPEDVAAVALEVRQAVAAAPGEPQSGVEPQVGPAAQVGHPGPGAPVPRQAGVVGGGAPPGVGGGVHARAVAPLQLARKVELARVGQSPEELQKRAAALAASLRRGAPPASVLAKSLGVVAKALEVERVLVFAPDAARKELTVRAGLHDDLDVITKEVVVPLKAPPSALDLFSQAWHGGKDLSIEDTFARATTDRFPPRYYEVIGAPAAALLPCRAKGRPTVLLMVLAESPDALPRPESAAAIEPLREVIAHAVR